MFLLFSFLFDFFASKRHKAVRLDSTVYPDAQPNGRNAETGVRNARGSGGAQNERKRPHAEQTNRGGKIAHRRATNENKITNGTVLARTFMLEQVRCDEKRARNGQYHRDKQQ